MIRVASKRKADTVFAGLGDHMTRLTQDHLRSLAKVEGRRWTHRSSESDAATFAPIFVPLPLAQSDVKPRGSGTKIHSAVIQGNLAESHRRTNATLHELLRYIEEDPLAWGYRIDPQQNAFLEVITTDHETPFKLYIIGHNPPPVPARLRHVVHFHYSPDYPTMFRIMHQADVVLPAFHHNSDYTKKRASSTIGVAVSARVSGHAGKMMQKADFRTTDAIAAVKHGNGSLWVLVSGDGCAPAESHV